MPVFAPFNILSLFQSGWKVCFNYITALTYDCFVAIPQDNPQYLFSYRGSLICIMLIIDLNRIEAEGD